MKEQHELDSLLKDKFDTREFEFQEAYWEEAAGLIAAAEAGSGKPLGFLWRWLIADSAIVLTLLMGIFLFSTKPPESTTDILTENNQTTQVETQPNKQPQTVKSAQDYQSQVEGTQSSISIAGLDDDVTRKDPQSQPLKNQSSISIARSHDHVTLQDQQSSISPDGLRNDVARKDPQSQPLKNQSSISPARSHDHVTLQDQQSSISIDGSRDNRTRQDRQSSISPDGSADNRTRQDLQSQSTAILSPPSLENVASENAPLSTQVKTLDSAAYILFTLTATGASPDERLLPAAQDAGNIKRHRFGFVAGLQSTQGFGNAETQKLSHWPTVGLKYAYAINSRFNLQSGMLLENRSALSFNKAFTSTQFGFGSNVETTSLQPQRMHYLALPLQLGFRFQKRHSITLGLNTAYLLDVHTTLTTQTTNPFGNLTEKEENAWGYRQGFQRMDAGLLMGYQFQFSPRMGLMLEAYQGFIDVSDDTFWEVTRDDKQRQVRVKVYWNIF